MIEGTVAEETNNGYKGVDFFPAICQAELNLIIHQRGKRFFLIIRDYKEEMHTDKTKFKKNNRFRRRL